MNPSTPTPSPPPHSASGDTEPFLLRTRRSLRRTPPPPLRTAARFFRRASSERMILREPSLRVRETAAAEVEERQSEWAYSKPVVTLDVGWNLSFLVVSAVVLWGSRNEDACVPLRVWILGYLLQGLVHSLFVVLEFRRRRRRNNRFEDDSSSWSFRSESDSDVASEQFLENQENRYKLTTFSIFLSFLFFSCIIS